ncbi:MAG: Nif3-like dinuclear metal center hexameric protein [Bacillota bacterium]
MKTSEIIKEIESFCPKSLSDAYVSQTGGYDNSGLLIGGEETSHDKMLVCIDIEQKDIDFAKENGIKFIFSHHPYIYGKIADVNLKTPKGREIISLVKGDITVFCAHLNLDIASGGIDDTLAKLLGGEIIQTFHHLEGGSYGKLSTIDNASTEAFQSELEEKFSVCKSVIKTDKINKIASFCGSGMAEEEFFWGIANGADTFVSSDIRHHLMVEASRYNVNIFDIPHGYSEFIAMKECIKNMNFAGVEIYFQSGKVGIKE